MKPQMLLIGWIRVIGFSVAASLLLATGAWAQVTFTVNTTDDGVDINPVDGNCSTIAPPAPPICTLRAAVMQANRIPNSGSIINLPAGTYKLTIPASIADGEENGDLNLIVPAGYNPGSTSIVGAGADVTTIDAQGGSRILRIDPNRTAFISGVALINGNAGDYGGGVYNNGSLHLTHSLIMHNEATYEGGGIYNLSLVDADFSIFSLNHSGEGGAISTHGGTVNLAHSTLDSNSASQGGGIYSLTTVNVDRSTLSRNTADYGGALKSNGSLVVTNSTISQNHGNVGGGGIYSVGGTSVFNSTIAYNQTYTAATDNGEDGGAGVRVISGSTFSLHNSILAGNLLVLDNSYSDCVGVIGFHGGSGLEGSAPFQCAPSEDSTGFLYVVDSANELGILKNNGGPTETIALLPTSGLIGNGPAEECNDAYAHHLTSDQRGNPRPPILQACDIGAFEYNELFRSSFDPPLP